MTVIPVTIITGFLGAGKTTLLNQLLQTKSDENVLIIVNEFGDVGVDSDLVVLDDKEMIVQLNNGCMCCILRQDLAETFFGILSVAEEKNIVINRIIIETSGLAEPSPIAQTILRTPVLNETMSIDSVLTLVDGIHWKQQLSQFSEAKNQILFADRILITKYQNITTLHLDELNQSIKEINPISDQCVISGKERFSDLIGLNLFDQASDSHLLESFISEISVNQDDHEEHHHHHTPVNTFVIETDIVFSERQITRWISVIIRRYGMRLLRYKGLIQIKGFTNAVIIQGVNMAFQLYKGKEWQQTPKTKIVFIGDHLPEDKIKSLLFNQK
ncbi:MULTISPECIES: GTP-binding protein [unclassified Leuconostoc]|uniref:CobW family GTP-binding protein n=1 Tax=unclassified Leuconostoc TaxID=2685106 RepID=UPI001906D270|nr:MULTISPECIES: GTP-binding protein [unclassified Leuconostoc]MBK0041288.1 GTP-binding protein [Leuconostoc sp. S51]MBK0051475.1 GTP-binding protein [Leuconostoc sp. S50]